LKGRVQREGEVIHVICDRIVEYGDLLMKVGDMSFPLGPVAETPRSIQDLPIAENPVMTPTGGSQNRATLLAAACRRQGSGTGRALQVARLSLIRWRACHVTSES
jgi:hypothetical protein